MLIVGADAGPGGAAFWVQDTETQEFVQQDGTGWGAWDCAVFRPWVEAEGVGAWFPAKKAFHHAAAYLGTGTDASKNFTTDPRRAHLIPLSEATPEQVHTARRKAREFMFDRIPGMRRSTMEDDMPEDLVFDHDPGQYETDLIALADATCNLPMPNGPCSQEPNHEGLHAPLPKSRPCVDCEEGERVPGEPYCDRCLPRPLEPVDLPHDVQTQREQIAAAYDVPAELVATVDADAQDLIEPAGPTFDQRYNEDREAGGADPINPEEPAIQDEPRPDPEKPSEGPEEPEGPTTPEETPEAGNGDPVDSPDASSLSLAQQRAHANFTALAEDAEDDETRAFWQAEADAILNGESA